MVGGMAMGTTRGSMWIGVAAVLVLAGPARAETAAERRIRILEEQLKKTQRELEELKAAVEQQKAIGQATQKQAEQAAEQAKTATAEVAKEKKPDTFRFFWKEGPKFETADGNFKLHLGGRIQNDWAVVQSSEALQDLLDIDAVDTGTEFRRARLELDGDIYRDFYFKFQLDFAGGEVTFKDVYLGAHHVPVVQDVRVGHFKEPFSLEELTSSNYITFMERGLPNVFSPERNTGVAILPNFLDERMTYSLGVFRGETQETGNGFGDPESYDLATRITGLPWYADDGAKLVHLGFSYVRRFLSDSDVRFRQRPESHLAPRFVDTDDFEASSVDVIDPELAVILGPASLQAEYMRNFVNADQVNDPAFDGWYAYLSYFLTGEHRVYKREAAAFDKVKPKRNFNFGPEGGWGAWEVGARLSKVNLDSEDVRGGDLRDATLGVNWYLNPNMRIMANYVHSDRTDTSGGANIWESRFQLFW
jgi:phosphate-selective porin OprO/OprP